MNQREIRENCYKCGHRSLVLIDESTLPTDFCDVAKQTCDNITTCDPSLRIPKGKETKYKKAVVDYG